MKIGDVELVVGAVYLVDGEEVVLWKCAEATAEDNGYAVFDNGDGCWELWYGKTEYYKKEGWHGVDGEGTEDEDGIVVEKIKETDDDE